MPVIAVVNRKGGSGKSTLATHLAAHCAQRGLLAMLGDVDRQLSTQTWLRLRATQHLPDSAPLLGWALDPRNVMRPPAGITHVILDTPGGLRGFDLARVVGYADAIVMPVCNSVFDRESAAECHAELMALPRIASGRCRVAAVGMRLDARTKAAETMAAWAADRDITYLGALRETQAYVRSIEQGLSLFDLPAAKVAADLAQWTPILDWLGPLLDKPGTRPAELDLLPRSVLAPVRPPAPATAAMTLPMDASTGTARTPASTAATPRPTVADTVPAAPRDVSPQALAQAARAALVIPPNLGEVGTRSLRQRLGQLLGAALPHRRHPGAA